MQVTPAHARGITSSARSGVLRKRSFQKRFKFVSLSCDEGVRMKRARAAGTCTAWVRPSTDSSAGLRSTPVAGGASRFRRLTVAASKNAATCVPGTPKYTLQGSQVS